MVRLRGEAALVVVAVSNSHEGQTPMKTSELLHFAFRARDPLGLGRWYAELFEGQFFPHPVMSALGIVVVKINHPEAVFDGLLEFWPWDLVWDGAACVFRKIEPQASRTSLG